MIRVLHIIGRLVRGGAEMRTVELMPRLAAMGVRCDVCVLIPEAQPLEDRVRAVGGEVHVCPLRPGLLSFPHRLRALLGKGGYDIVHSHTHYASGYLMQLAHRSGVPGRIIHFRSTGDGKPDTWRRLAYRRLMRYLADRHATAIAAVSRAAMSHAWGDRWRDDPRAEVIYNGLDLTPFDEAPRDPLGLRKELGLPPDSLLLINVARFDAAKAHGVLLDAVADVVSRAPRVHMVLVGDGNLRSAMEEKAQALGLTGHVHFLGVRSDVPRLLKGSDCFVLSSRREGLPGAVLEALAAQLPVVATDLPGVCEIAEYTPLITTVPVEDAAALARAVVDTLSRAERGAVSAAPFPPVFDLGTCADRVYAMYRRALGEETPV